MTLLAKRIYIGTACVLYGMILTGVLLVVRFPKAKFKSFCTGFIEKRISEVHCSIGQIEYDFPATFRLQNIVFQPLEKQNGKGVEISQLVITADMKDLGKSFYLSANVYGGQGKCRLFIKDKNDAFVLSDCHFTHIDMGKMGYLQGQLGRRFTGIVDLDGGYTGRVDKIGRGKFEGTLSIQNATMNLINPILDIENIRLHKADMNISINNKEADLEKVRFQGPEFSGAMSGKIKIMSPWMGSGLNMRGELAPLASLLARNPEVKGLMILSQKQHRRSILPFMVSGTLAAPEFRFGH